MPDGKRSNFLHRQFSALFLNAMTLRCPSLLHRGINFAIARKIHYVDDDEGSPDMVAICGVVWCTDETGDGAELPCICAPMLAIRCALSGWLSIPAFGPPGFGVGVKTGSFLKSTPGKRARSLSYKSLISCSLSSRSTAPSTCSPSAVAGKGRNFRFMLKGGLERYAGAGERKESGLLVVRLAKYWRFACKRLLTLRFDCQHSYWASNIPMLTY